MAVVYRPRFQSQFEPRTYTSRWDCTPASAAIAADRATLGGVLVTHATVRAASNEPNPRPDAPSPGLNLPQVIDVLAEWHIPLIDRTGRGWYAVLTALREGRGAIVQGDYDQLGIYKCDPDFDDPHAMFFNNLDTPGNRILVYDPICEKYRYVPVETCRKYAEKLTASVRFAVTRITPTIPKQIN